MWLSADPAMGEYIPRAPVDDDARKYNQNLPGMGGVYNYVNLHTYHYAGNNPVKLTDPDGEWIWIPLIIIAVVSATMITSDVTPPAPDFDMGLITNKLNTLGYGEPRTDIPTMRNANSNLKETFAEVKIGNNIVTAVGASLPVGGLTPDDFNDGRTSAIGNIMQAVEITSDIAERATNSDGYFAGDIIFTAYKYGGKNTNWSIKEAYTAPNGQQGYSEFSETEALQYLDKHRFDLKEFGSYDEIWSILH
jgi:hypothetical protein